MKELSERTKREMVAGARARIRFALERGLFDEVFGVYGGRVKMFREHDHPDEIILEVTSSTNGKKVLLRENVVDFPSETLLGQIMMVAG